MWQKGGVLFEWVSPHTLVPLALCAIGLLGFVLYSKRFPPYPIIRTSLFSSATGVVAHSGSVVHGVAVFSLLYYLPVYYGIAKRATVLESALYVLPNTVVAALTSAASGIVITKTGRYRLVLWVGWAAVAAGSGVLMMVDEKTTLAVGILLPLVAGCGIGILFATLGMAAQASVPATDASAASSMTNFFRSLGQTLGIAVGGVVVQNVFRREVEKNETYRAYAAVWARNIARVGRALEALTSPEEQALKQVVVSAVVQGTRAVWLLLCVLSATQLVASIVLVKNIDLDKPEAAKPRRPPISRPRLQMSIDPTAADSFVRLPNQI
ncbi:MFS general substrate transporter [Colletotrichum zoysiae]|uniref:MFS general substrate transporter n=1 Tax=Colletotrichum zoysiae TaxID=1216348 RepID=A0AAD9LSS9_9PEZI|nr:MFS general substrate transporter [Colletotrichum zoysiae]